jgi:PKHD-type hydroxylase
MITFIESQVPEQLQRELWFELNEVRALEGLKMNWINRVRLEFVLANLLRIWSRWVLRASFQMPADPVSLRS